MTPAIKNHKTNSLETPTIKSHKTNSLETPAMKSTHNSERTADLEHGNDDEKLLGYWLWKVVLQYGTCFSKIQWKRSSREVF